jgi:hypothetical protein
MKPVKHHKYPMGRKRRLYGSYSRAMARLKTAGLWSVFELPLEFDELLRSSEFNPLGLGIDVHPAVSYKS